jgi:hypothetical protein
MPAECGAARVASWTHGACLRCLPLIAPRSIANLRSLRGRTIEIGASLRTAPPSARRAKAEGSRLREVSASC